MTHSRRQIAFTLIELLLVVAVIVLLIGLLLPALSRSRDSANVVVCASNQNQIGQAQGAYLVDNGKRFPHLVNWAGLIGKKGTSGNYSASTLDVTARPLNKYVGNTQDGSSVDITQCPADLGDSFPSYNGGITNCYKFYGTSYLPQWNSNAFRAKMVYGPAANLSVRSMGMGQITSPKNKLLLADWSWHGNRPIADRMTRWHNKGNVRQFNTLFADMHVSYFVYPNEEVDVGYAGGSYGILPPDPGFLWW